MGQSNTGACSHCTPLPLLCGRLSISTDQRALQADRAADGDRLSHSKCLTYRKIFLLIHVRWLGQNSKQSKLQRQLTDIQIRMRLRVSGGRQEIREQYMPMLASKIVTPLAQDGSVSYAAYLRETG